MTVIDNNLVNQVAGLVMEKGFVIDLYEQLCAEFPSVRFTLCSDDDINIGKPVLENDVFAIYLVAGGEGCLSLTNDYDIASAVVIAEKVDD